MSPTSLSPSNLLPTKKHYFCTSFDLRNIYTLQPYQVRLELFELCYDDIYSSLTGTYNERRWCCVNTHGTNGELNFF